MDLKTSEKVVEKYGKVLKASSAAKIVMGMPKSSLPFDIKKIKEAIKLQIEFINLFSKSKSVTPRMAKIMKGARPSFITALKNPNIKYIEALKFGYAELARFIPDSNAKIITKFYKAISSGNKKHKDLKYYIEATKIMGGCNLESKKLLKEI